jgi:HlyD family secretion protein
VLVTIVAGAAVLAGGAFFIAQRRERAPAAPPPATAEVERRDIDVAAEAAGVVEPVRTVEVKSKASGEVLEVGVDTGDRVEEGKLLARIDPRDVQSAYDQAAADDEAARVHVRIAEAEEKRMEKIRAEGLASPQDLEAAQQASADARATLVRADTTLRLARDRLADVTIRAPTTGTILTRTVEPGQIIASATQNVSGGSTLFTMADLTTVQVRAKVDEVDIGQVRHAQRVSVSVDAYPGRTFDGEVEKIEPQAVVEQNVTLFPVLVQLGNPEGLLQPGMNADVSIRIASRENVVAVPNAAAVAPRDARAAAAALGIDDLNLREAAGRARENARRAKGQAPDGATAGTAAGGAPSTAESGAGAEPATPVQGTDGNEAASVARPGVLFVATPDGPQARVVRLGLSDWDYTEVLAGIEPGERVVLVSLAQMQKAQQEATERIRQRMSGPMGTTSAPRRPQSGGS